MSRELDKKTQDGSKALAPHDGGDLADPLHIAPAWSVPKGLFSFRYSSTEIFSEGGNLHVRLRETRYEDGRLKSEECEGTLDRQAYERAVSQAQGFFLSQVANFTRLLFAPLLSSARDRRHEE